MKKTELARKILSKSLGRRYGHGYAWSWDTILDSAGSEDFNDSDILSEGKDFIDAGAAYGFWSIRASRYYRKVVAFEPSKKHFPILLDNIRINGVENVEPIQSGLGAEIGMQLFNENLFSLAPEVMGLSFPEGETRNVGITTIDLITESRELQPSMIKLDVEGAELEVLSGAEKTIQMFKPKLIVEVHHPVLPQQVVDRVPEYDWTIRWRYLNTAIYKFDKQPHLRGIPK